LAENVRLKALLEILEEEEMDLCCKDWKYYLNFDYSQLTQIKVDDLSSISGESDNESEFPSKDQLDITH